MSQIQKIIDANELVENIKTAILGSVIITIRDSKTHELLWSCHTGEYYGRFKELEGRLQVDQEIDMTGILREMKNYLEN